MGWRPGLEGGGIRRNAPGVSFSGDGSVLKLTVVMVAGTCEYTENTERYTCLVGHVNYISVKQFQKITKPTKRTGEPRTAPLAPPPRGGAEEGSLDPARAVS